MYSVSADNSLISEEYQLKIFCYTRYVLFRHNIQEKQVLFKYYYVKGSFAINKLFFNDPPFQSFFYLSRPSTRHDNLYL